MNSHLKNRLQKFYKTKFFISDLRKEQILADITKGSDPGISYYLLLVLSALIATFGLLADSPAVVIGAMLVSPLMTPIFGISLSLVTGNTQLLRSALFAEAGGILTAIGSAVIVGLSPVALEVTPEILARTSPTLLDLLVATLAGIAGCLAIIDERISPILPGIAIATALTPPLAACGLCITFGAYEGAGNAFILFFANFLAILFVAGMAFVLSGFVRGPIGRYKFIFAKRFALASISLLCIAWFLNNSLRAIIEEKRNLEVIRQAVTTGLQHIRHLHIKDIILDQDKKGEKLLSLVVIDASREPAPKDLRAIESMAQEKLSLPLNLSVRTHSTQGVSSSGENLVQLYQTADGLGELPPPGPELQLLNIAEQVVRERLENIPGLIIQDMEFTHSRAKGKIVRVTLQGPVRPFPAGIAKMEEKIRQALNDPDVWLDTRFIETYRVASPGSPEICLDDPNSCRLQSLTREAVNSLTGLFAMGIQTRQEDEEWIVSAEVCGSRMLKPHEVQAVEDTLRRSMEKPVTLRAFSKVQSMVTSSGHIPGY